MALRDWFRRKREPSPELEMVERVISQHALVMQKIVEAVQEMAVASQKNSEVMQEYIQLFKTPGDPTRWEFDREQANAEELARAGFPKDADEKTQAEWVLNNLDRI